MGMESVHGKAEVSEQLQGKVPFGSVPIQAVLGFRFCVSPWQLMSTQHREPSASSFNCCAFLDTQLLLPLLDQQLHCTKNKLTLL